MSENKKLQSEEFLSLVTLLVIEEEIDAKNVSLYCFALLAFIRISQQCAAVRMAVLVRMVPPQKWSPF